MPLEVKEGGGAGGQANKWLSWRDLLGLASSLGVPHFQRGHVWEQGNVASLLESMYEGSPCGSLVLWPSTASTEEEASMIGGALVARDAASVRYWLVDGQQRLRSLVGVLAEAADDPGTEPLQPLLQAWAARPAAELAGGEEPDTELSPAVRSDGPWKAGKSWHVALPRLLPESVLKGTVLEAEQKQAKSMEPFRRLSRNLPSPRKTDSGRRSPPGPRGLVPLSWIWRAALTGEDIFSEALEQASTAEVLDRLAPWGARCVSGYAIGWADMLGEESPWKAGGADALNQWRAIIQRLRSDVCVPVLRKLAGLVQGPCFAIGYLPSTHSHSEVIEAYTRINRAGVRVRVEERAFADLMRRSSRVAGELRGYAREHKGRLWPQPADSAALTEADMRDRWWLDHAAERSFGFALWIRTVVRALTLEYCEASANGSGWQGPEALERWSLRDAVDKAIQEHLRQGLGSAAPGTPPPIEEACQAATRVLLLVDQVLAEQLGLDNPMGLPDTRFLLPVIDLLLRRKELLDVSGEDARNRDVVLGNLLLWLVCHRYVDAPHLTALHNSLRKCESATACIQELTNQVCALYCEEAKAEPPGKEAGLVAAVGEIARLAGEGLGPQLREAKTLRSRMVGLLYALERRPRDEHGEARAQEFDWGQEALERLRPEGAARRISLPLRARWAKVPGEAPPPEAEDLALQRQHMIPFNLARELVGGPTSPSAYSDANSIANLTWLTKRQNSFVGGIGPDMLDLESAGESAGNLAARGFTGAQLEHYSALYSQWVASKNGALPAGEAAWKTPANVQRYQRFLDARRDWILSGFKTWLKAGGAEFLPALEALRKAGL